MKSKNVFYYAIKRIEIRKENEYIKCKVYSSNNQIQSILWSIYHLNHNTL